MSTRKFLLIALATLSTAPLLAAENPAASCGEALELFESNDINGALEEARWCVEALEQFKQQQASSLFPDQVAGFEGGEIQRQNAMGFSIIQRDYRKGEQVISISLNKGSAGSMGGFAALAQMGMMETGKKLRIQRRTVNDLSEGSRVEFMVALKSGAMLGIESNNADHATVLEFAEQFPIAELDDSL